jgi:hypothetical protein
MKDVEHELKHCPKANFAFQEIISSWHTYIDGRWTFAMEGQTMDFPDLDMFKKQFAGESLEQLLEALVVEIKTASQLIHVQAEQVSQMSRHLHNLDSRNVDQHLLAFTRSLNTLSETVTMQQWLLCKKLDKVLQLSHQLQNSEPPKKNSTRSKN